MCQLERMATAFRAGLSSWLKPRGLWRIGQGWSANI